MRSDLGLKAYEPPNLAGLSDKQREIRQERYKGLLIRHNDNDPECIIFSDEKLFLAEECLSSQNDRVYTAGFDLIPESKINVSRFQASGSVMVFGAVSKKGKLSLIFVDPW